MASSVHAFPSRPAKVEKAAEDPLRTAVTGLQAAMAAEPLSDELYALTQQLAEALARQTIPASAPAGQESLHHEPPAAGAPANLPRPLTPENP